MEKTNSKFYGWRRTEAIEKGGLEEAKEWEGEQEYLRGRNQLIHIKYTQ